MGILFQLVGAMISLMVQVTVMTVRLTFMFFGLALRLVASLGRR